MKTEAWYCKKLQLYFDKHYGQYEDSVAWFNNPAPNVWAFVIPELNEHVELICDENGKIEKDGMQHDKKILV